jgi:hypothetical protein
MTSFTEQTVFIKNGSTIIESHRNVPSLGWMNVQLSPSDSQLSDLQLIDAIIDRIETNQGTVTLNPEQRKNIAQHFIPAKYPDQEFVCFPILQMGDARSVQIRATAIIAQDYRDEIARGRISFDRRTLFGQPR